jgi:hypothetical protein
MNCRSRYKNRQISEELASALEAVPGWAWPEERE